MSALLDMLMRHEGVRLKPYHDTVGKLTIGVGRNLDDVGISRDEAMYLLNNDVNRTVAGLRATYPWFAELSAPRQDAITDMTFNLGLHGFGQFHQTIAHLVAKRWSDAAKEMLDSHWAIQVGVRAQELATMIETGMYA